MNKKMKARFEKFWIGGGVLCLRRVPCPIFYSTWSIPHEGRYHILYVFGVRVFQRGIWGGAG